MIAIPTFWRSSTEQAAGLWPFSVSNSLPNIGVIVGKEMNSSGTVCMDPINWFRVARLISNPSLFILGTPGLGKSTLVSRIILGLKYQGIIPMILGDLKPDYTNIIKAIGGKVIHLGSEKYTTNILNVKIPDNLTSKVHNKIFSELSDRTYNTVAAIIEIIRAERLKDYENSILRLSLKELINKERADLNTLTHLLRYPTKRLLDNLDITKTEFNKDVRLLIKSINSVNQTIPELFDINAETGIDNNFSAFSIDISRINVADSIKTACSMIAAWHIGTAQILINQVLTDENLAKQNWYLAVFDELWRPLRSSTSIIDRLDSLTRLNRNIGVGQIMITHSLADMEAVDRAEDKAKARGFVERAGILCTFGLPFKELNALQEIYTFNDKEVKLVTSWSSSESWRIRNMSPGRGKFLIKTGSRIGIPCQMILTDIEEKLHNTESKWQSK